MATGAKKKKKSTHAAKKPFPLLLVLGIGGGALFLLLAGVGGIVAFWLFGGRQTDRIAHEQREPGQDSKPEEKRPDDSEPKNPPLAQDGLSPDVLNRVKTATVHITAKTADGKTLEGSGFFSTEPGLILTNAHVLGMLDDKAGPPSSIEVVLNGGAPNELKTPATYLGVDAANDLAALRVNVPNLPSPLGFEEPNALATAQKVFIAGYPGGRSSRKDITVNPTAIANLKKHPTGYLQEVQTSGGMSPGNSGGPVVTSAGMVAGVATGGVAKIHLAVPAEVVKRFINGRIGAATLGKPFLQNGKTKQPVQYALIDPVNRIKDVRVDVWTGPPGTPSPYSYQAPLPAPNDSPRNPQALTNKKTSAAKDIVLPATLPNGHLIWMQPVITAADGSTQWGPATSMMLPTGLLDLKPANLTVSHTKEKERTAKMKSTYTRSTPGKDKGVIGEKSNADLLEVLAAEPKGQTKLAKIRTAFGGLNVAIDKDGKKLEKANEKQALDGMKVVPPAFLIDNTNTIAGEVKPAVIPKGPAHDLIEEWNGLVKTPFDATTVPMPNRTVQPGETFAAKTSMTLRTESKPIDIDLALTCTYDGTRKRNDREEAVISVAGQIQGRKDSADQISGSVAGTIGFDLKGGFISYSQLQITADTPQRKIEQSIEVDRVAGNPLSLQIAQDPGPMPKDPPKSARAIIQPDRARPA